MTHERKRHPAKGGAVQLGGEQLHNSENTENTQPLDDLRALRALRLIQRFSLQPEAAVALALLAFWGAA